MAGRFFSGLSGLQLPIPKYQYPAEFTHASRLTYYATYFNSIEVNSSFYKTPMARTVVRWSSEVPDSFRFTFKISKEATHCKDLSFDPGVIHDFFNAVNHIDQKLGCILIQFPPKLKADSIYQLEKLLFEIEQAMDGKRWKLAAEFRDVSWYNEEAYSLLDQYHCAIVLQDIPKSRTPFTAPIKDHVYVRFHGPTGNYKGSYDKNFLAEYASYANEWLADGKWVFVYFNNTNGDAFNNLSTFNSMIQSA